MAWKILPRRSHKVAIFIFPSSCHKALKLFSCFSSVRSFQNSSFPSPLLVVLSSSTTQVKTSLSPPLALSRMLARTKSEKKTPSEDGCTRTPRNFCRERLSLSLLLQPPVLTLALQWYEVNWIIKYEWRIRVTLNHCCSFTFKSTACTWVRD